MNRWKNWKSWRSTLAGVASLILIGTKIVENPLSIADAEIQGGIAAAIGLIMLREGQPAEQDARTKQDVQDLQQKEHSR
jgi:hypothetical protein